MNELINKMLDYIKTLESQGSRRYHLLLVKDAEDMIRTSTPIDEGYELEFIAGTDVKEACYVAFHISSIHNVTIRFKFNGMIMEMKRGNA